VAFGLDLLPSMYSMPIGVMPKPHSMSSCLITDHSAGEFTLNNFITREDSMTHLDNLQDFGTALCTMVACDGHAPAWIFKSNVSAAYWHIPIHPLWQIKQVLTFEGIRHIDQNLTFSTCSVPKIWYTFFSLVIWIAIHTHARTSCITWMMHGPMI